MNGGLGMGGHGVYVWAAYAVFAIMLLWDILSGLLAYRRALRKIALQVRRAASKSQRPGSAA